MNPRFVSCLTVVVTLACAWAGGVAHAEYPARPVRLIVGASGGDPIDLLARLVAHPLSATFRQRFIIDNHPGAMGNLAAVRVAKAPADGHTLLVIAASFSTSVSIYPETGYHPERDFTPVAKLASYDQALVVNSVLAPRTLAEFLSFVRASDGRVTIASAGTGTTSHLAAELMKMRAGWLSAVHVPYRGNGQALAGLMGNHVHSALATVASAHPHVRTGRLRALAVASLARTPLLPGVPTFHESGFPGFEATAWSGLVAPAGTPYDAVVRLNLAVREALGAAATKQIFATQSAHASDETPEVFRSFLHREIQKWAKVVKALEPHSI